VENLRFRQAPPLYEYSTTAVDKGHDSGHERDQYSSSS
jgi:hypothetical protein